jgi:hypothetical protein
MNTAGQHESDCPLNLENAPKSSSVEELVERAIKNPSPGFLIQAIDNDEAMIDKYAGLLSTYCMTLDMMEVAADVFAVDRLQIVADFIKKALDKCINEIVVIQELRKNEEQ